MGQATIDMIQQINSLKQSLTYSTTTQCVTFDTPENLISVLKVNDQQIRFYWGHEQPRVILSNGNGDKVMDLYDLEGLPKECLSNREYLSAYLKQAYVRLSPYDNNEGYKLHFNLKLLGGANIIDPHKAPDRLWPNAIIPIFVDCTSFNANELKIILSAVNDWALNTTFLFKVHFRDLSERNSRIIYQYTETSNLKVSCTISNNLPIHQQFGLIRLNDNDTMETVLLEEEPEYSDSILIQKYTPSCMVNPEREESDSCNVCQSFVGRMGGEQLISCKLGESFDEGALKHELGHAIGFYHEQQRPDRDEFVSAPNLGVNDPNYGKRFQSWFRQTYGEYDFKSIMHYFFGAGMVGTQKVRMDVQKVIPIPQYRQLIELGAPGYTPSFQRKALLSESNRRRALGGLNMVGKTGSLSQTDIEAANYLANAARCISNHNDPNTDEEPDNDKAASYVIHKARNNRYRRWN